MKKFRLISQIFFFILFLYIFFSAIIDSGFYGDELRIKGSLKWFFGVDPFLWLVTFLASHSFEKVFLLSIIFILLTFIFGRVFCGWVCPFGTVHHFFTYIAVKTRILKYKTPDMRLLNLKYYIFFTILIGGVFGINFSGYFDPLSILVKGFGIFLMPVFAIFYKWGFLPDSIKDFMFYNMLGRENFYYSQSALVGIIFVTLIAMNFVRERFWCKYLCSLGAFYGIAGRYSVFKISQNNDCHQCVRCDSKCFAGAVPSKKEMNNSECMLLFDCIETCPDSALEYKIRHSVSKSDLSKRGTLKAVLTGAFGILIFKTSKTDPLKNELLIRPPGAVDEPDFLSVCIRCGGCMKVCPENFLKPAFFQAGFEGMWTPLGDADIGYCEYNCNLCGQICPTGAIKNISLAEKKRFVIGTAYFDKNRCIPYVFKTNCMVCEEHCPTSPKAIKFKESDTKDIYGNNVKVKEPNISPELCIGCGVCQFKCPVSDKPAIYITSVKSGGLIGFKKNG